VIPIRTGNKRYSTSRCRYNIVCKQQLPRHPAAATRWGCLGASQGSLDAANTCYKKTEAGPTHFWLLRLATTLASYTHATTGQGNRQEATACSTKGRKPPHTGY
jgi:hypothetical protein